MIGVLLFRQWVYVLSGWIFHSVSISAKGNNVTFLYLLPCISNLLLKKTRPQLLPGLEEQSCDI
jgi:hypothetical protein